MAVADALGVIRASNPAWDRQVGHTTRTLSDLFPGVAHRIWQTGAVEAEPLAVDATRATSWWNLEVVAHPEVQGFVLVTAHDVTERVLDAREAEDARAALHPINSRLRLAQDAAGIGTWEWDATADRQAWSPTQFRLHGLDPAVAMPPSFEEWQAFVVPEDREKITDALALCRGAPEAGFQVEFRIRRADTGEIRWLLSFGTVTKTDADGNCTHILGVNLDITDRRVREDELRASEARLRQASEAADIHAWEWDLATDAVVWDDGLEQALGLPAGGFGGSLDAFRAMLHPDDCSMVEAAWRRAVSGEVPDYRAKFRMYRADGTIRWTETRGTVIRDDAGQPLRVVGMDYDVTEQKATLDALLEGQSRLRQFIEYSPASLAIFDLDMRFLAVSRRFLTDHGLPPRAPEELTGRSLYEVLPNLPDAWIAIHRLVLNGETGGVDDDIYLRPDGGRETVCWSMTPWFTADGAVGGAMLTTEVTTARRATETALAESEAKFRALAEAMPQLIYTATADGVSEYKNQRWLDYSGLTPEEARDDGWIGLLHPDDRDASIAAWQHALQTGESFEREHRLRGKDGEYRWFLARAVPLRAQADGRVVRWLGTATDISELVNAHEATARTAVALEAQVAEGSRALAEATVELQAEIRRRQDMQSALMQSQKLETLGQLTAGVAHDFNNVLAAIQGSFEIVARQVNESRVARVVDMGMGATKRAIALTRQLLDFGRSHSLEPTVVDVEASIRHANELIGHAVGPRIRRYLSIQKGVWPVLIDDNQLEVALLNLAINAKDAMPDGGQLVLEVRNLSPEERPEALPFKDFVCISIKDTGQGMPADVAARATEPFFTTKPPGKGTGLGLPMVHAFASRSGGMLRIDSREGVGTTMSIILPRAVVSGMEIPDVEAANTSAGAGRPQATVLLVENDEQVRNITAGYLFHQGYNVLEAPHAEAATALSVAIERLDILVTEVALPGMDGLALATRLRNERPGLPVVFVTGLLDCNDLADEHVLLKPFTGADLMLAIQQRLSQDVDSETADGGLLRRLKNPSLLAAYLFWRAERHGRKPPRLIDMDWGGLPDRDNVFTAAVEREGENVRFRFMHVGSALVARSGLEMGGTRIATKAEDDEVLGSLASAYARSARTFAPFYDYARYDFGDGKPVLFERLILPISDDGEHVTHLIGMVLFAGDI